MSKREMLGLGMMVAAGVLILVALLAGWRTLNRAIAISHLSDALSAMGDVTDVDRSTRMVRRAAADLPNETAAVLPSLDLGDAASKQRLEQLYALCEPAQRPLIEVTRTYGEVLRGEATSPPAAGDDPDLALLAAVVQMRLSQAPVDPHLPEHAMPHLPVLMLYQLELLKAGLAARSIDAIAAGSGALAVLNPGHREFTLANLVAMGLSSKPDFSAMTHMRDLCPDKARLAEVMVELAELVPERRQVFIALGVQTNVTANVDEVVRDLAQAATDGRVDPGRAAEALLALGQPQQALPLLAKLPAPQQDALARLLHNRIGDTAALATLGAGDPTILPRCTVPVMHRGIICFHVSNQQGCLPRTGVSIHLNGALVDAKQIHRAGTLFGLRGPAQGDAKLEVFAGTQSIYSGTVAP